MSAAPTTRAQAEADGALRAENAALQEQVESQKTQLDWFRRQLFGRTSEKRLHIDPALQADVLAGLKDAAPQAPPQPSETITYERLKQRNDRTVTESGLRFDDNVPVETIEVPNPELDGVAMIVEPLGDKRHNGNILMQRFKNILLVSYGNGDIRAALKRAVRLTEENQAQLTLVGVVEKLPEDAGTPVKGMSASEVRDRVTEQHLKELANLTAPIEEKGIQIRTKVLVGTPFIEIIREVLRNEHDLVIKSTHGKAGRKATLFRSTDMQLMRACPCPVWLVKPSHRKEYARILAAVDPDPSDEEKNRLNTLIMDLATSLAELEHSELHVVHAWVLYSEKVLKVLIGNVKKLAQDTRKRHRKWLKALLGKYTREDLKIRVHLLEGKAQDLIPELAKKKQVELIVLGTVARTGLPGFLIGNRAENILSQVDCSVLTVKPEGFISPVQLPSIE